MLIMIAFQILNNPKPNRFDYNFIIIIKLFLRLIIFITMLNYAILDDNHQKHKKIKKEYKVLILWVVKEILR